MIKIFSPRLNKFLFLASFSLIFVYLFFHAFSGERGLTALVKLNNKQTKLMTELEQKRADRIKFEHKVNLIKPDSLDLDLLEERAKEILGLVNKKEKLIINKKEELNSE